jgi:hypothetical protein
MAVPQSILDYYGDPDAQPEIIAYYEHWVWKDLPAPHEIVTEELIAKYDAQGITGLTFRWDGNLGTYWIDKQRVVNPYA